MSRQLAGGKARSAGTGITMALLVACCVVATAHPAHGFKWHACPAPPLPVYPSALGATNAPFVHPGHELRIVLNDDEVAATGGFSLEPDGNRIFVTFRSLFGQAEVLPARTASAASPAVLSFDFPDGRSCSEVGRTLAGPAEIRVVANGRLVAHILATDLVGLPPASDVTDMFLDDDAEPMVVQAALGADGDIWVPASFHGESMVMPSCPGKFIVPLTIQLAGATVLGDLPPGPDPLAQVSELVGYLGDIEIGGLSFYGMLYPQRIQPVHVAGTLGVSICRRNDAIDLVLRVRGNQSWAGSDSSPFRFVAADSAPIALQLKISRPLPSSDQSSAPPPFDSFGNPCSTAQTQPRE